MATTISDLIERKRGEINTRTSLHNEYAAELDQLRSAETVDEPKVEELRGKKAALVAELENLRSDLTALEKEQRDDEAMVRLQATVTKETVEVRAHEARVEVVSEPRTYARENDRTGKQFALDVSRAFLFNDMDSQSRLQRHMQEERVERGDTFEARAAGSGAFTGLVVPQYLVDQFAPAAKAGRPFADAARKHELPATGMTAYLGKVTTATSTALQSSENASVSETDIDDTLLTITIQTAAGSQTVSRQAAERGIGVEDTVIDDLIRNYAVTLDSTLLNQATNGLTNVATSIAYTDASPTAAELYPKLLAGPAAVEAALLDTAAGDTIAVMHSRRWYWLQSQLGSTWPLFGQPGIATQAGGLNYGERYGAGFRGILPSGIPVIVDNNIATNLGAGTNEDEVYFVAQSESHLWEDPNAPLLIRAEQTNAKSLGVNLVVYGYFAYTHARRSHAQKIAGTGLVTPTF